MARGTSSTIEKEWLNGRWGRWRKRRNLTGVRMKGAQAH
jgi:hypothetical protein